MNTIEYGLPVWAFFVSRFTTVQAADEFEPSAVGQSEANSVLGAAVGECGHQCCDWRKRRLPRNRSRAPTRRICSPSRSVIPFHCKRFGAAVRQPHDSLRRILTNHDPSRANRPRLKSS